VLNIQNKRNGTADPRLEVADDIGRTYARYGLPTSVGRVFGLLLASNEPLSLDEIALTLGISKSGASVAARDLERVANAFDALTDPEHHAKIVIDPPSTARDLQSA